jgi:flagellar hook-associated protein 2
VDGSGNGSFTLNGVAISYNTATDTLNSLVTRINASGAGVTAAGGY